MLGTIQILRANADILTLLNDEYNRESEQCPPHCYPDHLLKPMIGIEEASLHDPLSVLFRVADYEIYLIEVLEILQKYPLVLLDMCNYVGTNGKSTLSMIEECVGHDYVMHIYSILSAYQFV